MRCDGGVVKDGQIEIIEGCNGDRKEDEWKVDMGVFKIHDETMEWDGGWRVKGEIECSRLCLSYRQ